MRDPLGIVGTTVDRRYAIRRFVAEGGFGIVYEAEALALGVKVAIKVLRSEILAQSPEARARFEQEARVLARLRHPGIVSITDASHLDDGTPYLALEWIDGETLDSYINRVGALPLDDTLRVLGPVARAIAHAHEQDVIHRDLKPSNVMIARDTQSAKVLDFGLARWASPHGVRTSTQSGTGLSIGFAAPEQYGKEFGPVDARADQFALAAVTYAVLTAKPPFAGESLTEVMWATCMAGARPSIAPERPDLPRALDEVLTRALSIRPEARFESIRDFWSALEAAAQHGDATSRAPATIVQGPPTRTAGALPDAATLPSPQLRVEAPSTQKTGSLHIAPTMPAMTGPAGTTPTGASRSSEPPSAAPSTRASPATKWTIVVAIGAILGAGVFTALTVFAPAPPKPGPNKPPKVTPSASTSTSSAAPSGPCGKLDDHEACITGGKLHRGPYDCQVNDPAHRAACPFNFAEVATFVIDRHEVSYNRWQRCVKAGKCRALDPEPNLKLPVRNVTHADAIAFCTNDGKRLPTDAEFELAAAGLGSREYPWGNDFPGPGLAVFDDLTNTPTAPAAVDAQSKPTPENVLHLAGNVAEWTSTNAPASRTDDAEKVDAPYFWVRGGAYNTTSETLKTWARVAYPEAHQSPAIGFRCARTPKM